MTYTNSRPLTTFKPFHQQWQWLVWSEMIQVSKEILLNVIFVKLCEKVWLADKKSCEWRIGEFYWSMFHVFDSSNFERKQDGEEIKRNKPSFMLGFSLHRKRWKLESIQSLATSSTDLSRGGMVTSSSKLSNGGYASPSTPCATASSFTYLHYDTFPMVFNISCLLYFCTYSSSRSNEAKEGAYIPLVLLYK